jgi:hypothetical protein
MSRRSGQLKRNGNECFFIIIILNWSQLYEKTGRIESDFEPLFQENDCLFLVRTSL